MAMRTERAPTFTARLELIAFVVLALAGPAGWSAGQGGVRIAGHRPVAALARSTLLGPVPADERVRLAITLPLRNQAELDDLLRGLYDPRDSLFGRYLTPEGFVARFGPTRSDYEAVAASMRSLGLSVAGMYPNRTLLDVEGSAATVQRAFAVNLHRYRAPGGRLFRAPDADPVLPAAAAGRVAGVVGLDTAGVWRPHVCVWRPVDRGTSGLGPAAGPLQTGSGPGGGLTPTDIRTAYGLNGTGRTGAGQTLAVFELDGYRASDITAYRSYYGVPNIPLQNILIDGVTGAPGSGALEVTLDIELQMALAPGATRILVYEGPNTDTGVLHTYNRIATDNLAKQISTSWGLYELASTQAFLNSENTIFQQMAAQGQSIYAAAGDSGAYDNGSTLSVDDPGSQPYMVAVGGTKLRTNGAGGAWLSETTWNTAPTGGGGGISAVWPIPSYQVGVVSSPSFGSNSKRNVPDVAIAGDPNSGYSVYFGGWAIVGGTSCGSPLWAAITALVNEQRAATSQSSLGFANPALYQIGQSASYASAFHDIADGSTNRYYPAVTGYDCATGWGTPIGTGLLAQLAPPAVAVQVAVAAAAGKIGEPVTLSATLTRTSDGTPVSGETLQFAVAGADAGSATTGPDGIATRTYTIPAGTGAGSRAIAVQHAATGGYAAASGNGTLTVSKCNPGFSFYAATGAPGQTVNLRAVLASGSTLAVGRWVTFTVDGTYSAGGATTDANGIASAGFAIPVGLAAGTHNVTATFDGSADTVFNSAARTASVLKVGQPTALSFYSASGRVGGSALLRVILLSGSTRVAGRTVSFSVDGAAAGSGTTDANGVAAVTYPIPTSMTVGTHTVGAVFAGTGDPTYLGTSRAAPVLSVTGAATAISFYAASGSPGQTVNLRCILYSGGSTVSGKVISFAVDGTAAGSAQTDSTGTASLAYTIPGGMAAGTHNVNAAFAGDSTYAATSRTAAVLTVK